MRGEDDKGGLPVPAEIGNTPTCVGKTANYLKGSLRRWKHPHMRGEDEEPERTYTPAEETPPHAWGRRKPPLRNKVSGRNTPTCVGKTTRKVIEVEEK